MAKFYRSTRAQIDERITSDFEYEQGSQAARMPQTIERAFVKATGGAVHGLYGRLESIYRSFFPHLADESGVVKIALLFGLPRNPATRAEGDIIVSGTAGTIITAATARWVRADGRVYRLLEDYELLGTPGGEAVPGAAEVSGAAGNCDAGTKLTLQSPIVDVASAAEAGVGGMTGGTDREDWRDLRQRLLERLDEPPTAGGPGSYIRWAKEVSGVTRAWEFGKVPKLGHVTVLFLRDGDADPFPAGGELTDVETQILKYAPLHLAGLHVMAPIKKAITIEVGSLNPNTDAVKTAVRASIMSMLKKRAEPAPADNTKFYRSWISEAISGTVGEIDHKLNVPASDITLNQWEIPWVTDPLVHITFVP